MTGIFQTTLSPIYTATQNGNVRLELANRHTVDTLIKVNDDIIDNVTLSGAEVDEDNIRVLNLNLLNGDVISAQASIADEVRFTITD